LNYGEYVARRRRELGLTQREVASRAGLSFQYLSDMERGKRQPARIGDLSRALDVPQGVLYWLAGQLPPELSRARLDPAGIAEVLEVASAYAREVATGGPQEPE
jgi:transcriptional regulator with XRE-family HTH domain